MAIVQQITDKDEIRIHLTEVSGLRIPMNGTIQGVHRITHCRLIYGGEQSDGIHVNVTGGSFPLQGRIILSYTTIQGPYTFNSLIESAHRSDPRHALLTIRPPDFISRFNRRKYIRIQPPRKSPIVLNLELPVLETVHPEVEDISSGGVAFIVPRSQSHFDIGKQYPARLCIPGVGEINSRIASRNLKKIFNMFRVGAEFIDISEEDRKAIEIYALKLESDGPETLKEMDLAPKPVVLILDSPRHGAWYECLASACDIVRVSPDSAVTAAAVRPPELIVLNLDIPDSAVAFKAAHAHPALKGKPMILLSARKRDLFFQIPEWQFMPVPFPESLFVRKTQQLIEDFRRSRKLEAILEGQYPEKKILILDFPKTFGFRTIESLKGHRYRFSIIYHRKDILRRMVQAAPQIIVINAIDDPGFMDICHLMKLNKTLRDIPKILVHEPKTDIGGLVDGGLITEAMASPVNPGDLLARLQAYGHFPF